jgi:hypothetical protein
VIEECHEDIHLGEIEWECLDIEPDDIVDDESLGKESLLTRGEIDLVDRIDDAASSLVEKCPRPTRRIDDGESWDVEILFLYLLSTILRLAYGSPLCECGPDNIYSISLYCSLDIGLAISDFFEHILDDIWWCEYLSLFAIIFPISFLEIVLIHSTKYILLDRLEVVSDDEYIEIEKRTKRGEISLIDPFFAIFFSDFF